MKKLVSHKNPEDLEKSLKDTHSIEHRLTMLNKNKHRMGKTNFKYSDAVEIYKQNIVWFKEKGIPIDLYRWIINYYHKRCYDICKSTGYILRIWRAMYVYHYKYIYNGKPIFDSKTKQWFTYDLDYLYKFNFVCHFKTGFTYFPSMTIKQRITKEITTEIRKGTLEDKYLAIGFKDPSKMTTYLMYKTKQKIKKERVRSAHFKYLYQNNLLHGTSIDKPGVIEQCGIPDLYLGEGDDGEDTP
jgi:hypothetical protein